ncbi:unnamed protein product [Lactuca saligna]|uniref:Uncharacterized protein n=1 Tax=Lactuca saligna TaxID=75948 RepID=A0AA36EF82_LACSI|nr:unnamed protein product [Lactuca saligna]
MKPVWSYLKQSRLGIFWFFYAKVVQMKRDGGDGYPMRFSWRNDDAEGGSAFLAPNLGLISIA